MTEHYYTNQPDSMHHREEWSFELVGKSFAFMTDAGVFSKRGVDFGSRVLIDHFDAEDLPAGALLDVGCGYGPIGLALAYKMDRFVEMIDVNQRALDLAQENAQHNHLADKVAIYSSDIYQNVRQEKYSGIVSNPPIRAGKKVVHQILAEAYPLLAENGVLTVVIQKKQGAPSAEKKMMAVFGNVEILAREKGYYVLQSRKNTA